MVVDYHAHGLLAHPHVQPPQSMPHEVSLRQAQRKQHPMKLGQVRLVQAMGDRGGEWETKDGLA
jgi:hypothetical protein